MIHLHLIGLLTLQFLVLIAAVFLVIYLKKQELHKCYNHLAKGILIALHVLIIATFVHGLIFHFSGKKCVEKETRVIEKVIKSE